MMLSETRRMPSSAKFYSIVSFKVVEKGLPVLRAPPHLTYGMRLVHSS